MFSYTSYQQLEKDFSEKKIHPSDLKTSAGKYVSDIVRPIGEKLVLSPELYESIKATT